MKKSTNAADYQHAPAPVAAMPKDYARGTYLAPHSHVRAQLAWAVAGVITVTAQEGTWIVPSQRAVWIPAGVVHAIRMSGGPVSMHSLYIDERVAALAGRRCKVILMSGLLRELVLEMADAPLQYELDSRLAKIADLILAEISRQVPQELHLPMPRDPRLRGLCEALLAEPGRDDTLERWSESAGASSRTLARLFASDLGVRFTDWRCQARLAAALARLAQGMDVATVARDVGYRSPSAFTAMFRKTLGAPPRDYLA